MAWKNIPGRPGWLFKDDAVVPSFTYLGAGTSVANAAKTTAGVRTEGGVQTYIQTRKTTDAETVNRGEIDATSTLASVGVSGPQPASFFSDLPAVGGGGGGDPFFANVVYLVNATGDITGSSATLYATDASSRGGTITARNGLTTQPHDGITKFQDFAIEGNGTVYFLDELNNGITGGTLGAGEYTIECWCYPVENGNFEILSTRTDDIATPNSGIGLVRTNTGELMVIRGNGTEVTSGTTFNDLAWNHVAVTRDASNVTRAYVNGVKGLEYTDTRNYSQQGLTILEAQAIPGTGGGRWKGYVEDVRITKGVARYTGNTLTVPTAKFYVPPVPSFSERAFTYALTSETDPTSASWTTKPAGYTYYPGEGIGADAPITSMSSMFRDATAFNQDISSWDVSSVQSMIQMFYNANLFNQDLSSWNVSSVTNMNFMFYNASVFDQDISGWNVLAASVAPGNSTPPSGFDTGTPGTWTTAEKPQWGTDGT